MIRTQENCPEPQLNAADHPQLPGVRDQPAIRLLVALYHLPVQAAGSISIYPSHGRYCKRIKEIFASDCLQGFREHFAEVSLGQATPDGLGQEAPHRISQNKLGFMPAPALLFRQGESKLDYSPVRYPISYPWHAHPSVRLRYMSSWAKVGNFL